MVRPEDDRRPGEELPWADATGRIRTYGGDMSTAHIGPSGGAARSPRLPTQQQPPPEHGGGPAGHHDNPLKAVLRRAGILVGTVARVTILGRDGVDL